MENLERKLGIFAESASNPNDPTVTPSYREICRLEAEYVFHVVGPINHAHRNYRDLKRESYGVELLQTIGFVYTSRAKQFLGSNHTLFGVGGWIHNVQGKYHVFSET